MQISAGAVTSAGLNAPSSFAALRTRLNDFNEVPFIDTRGEPISAGAVSLGGQADRVSSIDKQIAMLAHAISECLNDLPWLDTSTVPLLLCVAEVTRKGRIPTLESSLKSGVEDALKRNFSAGSAIYAYGQAGAMYALNDAFGLIKSHPFILIAAVDSYVNAATLLALHKAGRILSTTNQHGFIPGEAACAVLVGAPDKVAQVRPRFSNVQRETASPSGSDSTLFCTGLGITREVAVLGGAAPNKAIALADAIKVALGGLPAESGSAGLRISGQSSEDFYAKEFAVAAGRTNVSATPLWMLADSLGETGAAAGLLAIAWAYASAHKGYLPSLNTLCLMASDEGERAAALFSFGQYQAQTR